MRDDIKYLEGFIPAPVVITAVQVAIEDAGGPISLPQIRAATGISRGKIARCLNRLLGKGMVRRWRGERTVTYKHAVSGLVYDVKLPIWIYERVKD